MLQDQDHRPRLRQQNFGLERSRDQDYGLEDYKTDDGRSVATCSLYAVVRPSVVCNVRAPYSADWNFRPYFYAIWYLGHSLHPSKILRRSSQGNPSVGMRELNAKWVAEYSYFETISKAISPKRCKLGGKLVLITNRKSHMSFRLVPNSVTLNGVIAHTLRYSTEFGSFQGALCKSGWRYTTLSVAEM